MSTSQNNNETYFHFKFLKQNKKLYGPEILNENNDVLLFAEIEKAKNIRMIILVSNSAVVTSTNMLK